MVPAASSSRLSSSSTGSFTWRPTKIMHMRDLSKDDDFLSHLLVEKLGTGTVPLLVHKMDSSRRLPKTDTQDLMGIVRRLVVSKGPLQLVIRQAVDELLTLAPIRYFLRSYTQKQINAFATHASRYFELYHPSGCIEIAHTSRYSHHTGKSELCILATRNLAVGSVLTELKGSMANLTDEEDKELKRTDLRNSDIRRDFSVIHSKSMKKNHLFLGPARFVNHDCDNNCELFREGRYITFRVLRPIAIGEEITAHYGDGYFGKRNRHCLCETCEKTSKGGYSPEHQEDEAQSSSDSSSRSDSDSDSDSDTSSSDSEADEPKSILNLNERRTRRGVYAVTKTREVDSDDSDNEDDNKLPLADAKDIPADDDIELTAEIDAGSDLTSLAPSMPPSDGPTPEKHSTPGLMTPVRGLGLSRSSSSLTELTSSTGRSSSAPKSTESTPFPPIIATRRQKAWVSEVPGNASLSSSIEPSPKRLTRSISSLILAEKKGKGKATPTPISTPHSGRASKVPETEEMKIKKEELKIKKEELKIKKEDIDARVLRARPSFLVPEAAKEPPPKPDVPRGADGKPLPICSTCSNVLPLIAVDSNIVWGLGLEGKTKKKNAKHDCPRCIRHFAIYQQTWPSRVAPHGTISTTPREASIPVEPITKKVSRKGLHVLDQKLVAAAAASVASKSKKLRKHRRVEEEQEGRPTKRRKSEPEPVLSKAKVTKTYSSISKKSKRALSPEPEGLVKRKRGRPRLSSPKRTMANPEVKELEPPVIKQVLSQPRAINGRFGKKDKFMKKNGESNTSQSSSSQTGRSVTQDGGDAEDSDSQEHKWTSPSRKRSNDALDEMDDYPRKRVSESNVEPQPEVAPQKVVPHRLSGFRGGGLNFKPNPQKYALHAWSGPIGVDYSSSSDDEKHPETPEDDQSSVPSVVAPEEEPSLLFPPSVALRAPLTCKPSPFAFAKSRWNGPTPLSQAVPGRKPSLVQRETLHVTPDKVGSLSPLPEGYSSPLSSIDGLPRPKLRHIYPVLPPVVSFNAYIPKSTTFPSLNSETTPTFINAGWDDASDTSEA